MFSRLDQSPAAINSWLTIQQQQQQQRANDSAETILFFQDLWMTTRCLDGTFQVPISPRWRMRLLQAPFVSLGDMAYEEGVRSEKRNTGKKEASMRERLSITDQQLRSNSMQMTLQKRCFSLEKKYPDEYQVSRETSQVTLLMVWVEMGLMNWGLFSSFYL